jgi:hypothetical protein
LDIAVQKIVQNYEILANKAIDLNQSYLDMLKLYEGFSLGPDFATELEKKAPSPLTIIQQMAQDQQLLKQKFEDLGTIVHKAKPLFPQDPEAEALGNIANDCEVMVDFVSTIDLEDLKQMFKSLSNS